MARFILGMTQVSFAVGGLLPEGLRNAFRNALSPDVQLVLRGVTAATPLTSLAFKKRSGVTFVLRVRSA